MVKVRTFLFVATLVIFGNIAFADDELKIVIEAFRHGARAPIDVEFDTPTGIMDYDVPLGNLTPTGMRQHFLLGTQLRKRYVDDVQLLSPSFDQSEMHLRSTQVNRTLQSIASHLSGLYPMGTGPTLKNDAVADMAVPQMTIRDLDYEKQMLGLHTLPSLYNPIPVHNRPNKVDYMLSSWHSCDKIGTLKKQALKTDKSKDYLNKEVYPILSDLGKVVGMSVEDLKDPQTMMSVYSELNCGYFAGKNLPDAVDADFLKKMEVIPIFYFYYYLFGIKEAAQLNSSQFFDKMHDMIKDRVIRGHTCRMGMFSAHDITLAGFMSAMGQPLLYPAFASSLIFEVYRKEDSDSNSTDYSDYYVTGDFNNTKLTLPGCDDYKCPLRTFMDFLDANILDDVPSQCETKDEMTSGHPFLSLF